MARHSAVFVWPLALALLLLSHPAASQDVLEGHVLPADLPLAPASDIDFGAAVAIQGDALFVGAPGANADEGRVFVYRREGVQWVFDQELAVAVPSADNASFGSGLDVNGDLLAISSESRVFAFREAGGVWIQEMQRPIGGLKRPSSVAVAEDAIALCQPALKDFVQLYRRTNGVWSHELTLMHPVFSQAVDVELHDDETLLVGWERWSAGSLPGEVEIESVLTCYERVDEAWQLAAFESGATELIRLGRSIQARGGRAVSTGNRRRHNALVPGTSPGHVFEAAVLERVNGVWRVEQQLPDPPTFFPLAGFAGDVIAMVGQSAHNNPSSPPDLHAELVIYREEGGVWGLVTEQPLEPAVSGFISGADLPHWDVVSDGQHFVGASRFYDSEDSGDGSAFVFRASPFGQIESGELAGSGGVVPQLVASGPLTPDSDNTITLSDALPFSTTALLSGLGLAELPFKGGVLVPTPNLIFNSLLALPVNAAGERALMVHWPPDVPAGTKLYLQHWVVDPEGPLGYSASNGLELVAQ